MSTTATYRKCAPCPWGEIQETRSIADGIDWLSTAGHAGFRLSKERFERMPEHLRNISFTSDQYFEEDVSWCAVPIAFPEAFSKGMVQAAQDCYDSWHRNNLSSGK
jgi:hypothetical protein